MHVPNTIFTRLVLRLLSAASTLVAAAAYAASPGITGTNGANANFALVAAPGYISQPDGTSIYSWGYGCNTAPGSSQFKPVAITTGTCRAGKMR